MSVSTTSPEFEVHELQLKPFPIVLEGQELQLLGKAQIDAFTFDTGYVAIDHEAAKRYFAPNEFYCLPLASLGLRNYQIGQEVFLSEDTIKTYMSRGFRKMRTVSPYDRIERPTIARFMFYNGIYVILEKIGEVAMSESDLQ